MSWQFYDKNGALKQAASFTSQELAYIERVTGLTTIQTTSASADIFLTAPNVVCDGISKIKAEIFVPEIFNSSVTNYGNVFLFEDGVIKTVLGREFSPSTTQGNSLKAEYEFIPSAGVHTYSARISVSGGTGTFNAGAAAGATFPPASLRISRADWAVYVPSKSPRITTSLLSGGPPGAPDDGDIWIATNVDANGSRWQFQYDVAEVGTYKWKFIGGAPLQSYIVTQENPTTGDANGSDYRTATLGPSLTIPRAGEYQVEWGSDVGTSIVGYAYARPIIGNAVTWVTGGRGQFQTGTGAAWNWGRSEASDQRKAFAINDVIRLVYWFSAGVVSNWYFGNRSIQVLPLRIF